MSRAAVAASPPTPDAWADVMARYLEALRLTHYAADTVHIRALYLKYFTAWAAARGLTKPEDITRAVLERYQRWRRFDTMAMGLATNSLNFLFSNESTLLRTVRDIGLGLVDRAPPLKSLFIRQAAGLSGEVPRLLKGEAL